MVSAPYQVGVNHRNGYRNQHMGPSYGQRGADGRVMWTGVTTWVSGTADGHQLEATGGLMDELGL